MYILQPGDLPLWYVMEYGDTGERVQELNCRFVAVTRAKSELIFLVHVDRPAPDAPRGWTGALDALFPMEEGNMMEDVGGGGGDGGGYGGGGGGGDGNPEDGDDEREDNPWSGWQSYCKRPKQQASKVVTGDVRDAFSVLGLSVPSNHDDDGKEDPEPDAHDVKTALTKKLRICHPDKQTRGGLTEEAATMATVALLKAHETVCAFLFHGGD